MPDTPIILGFDTSAAHCAAAVVRGDRVLAQRIEPMARGQAERLFPLIDALLVEAGAGWTDLDAIGVGVGPGNFTGIRIAVAAARGLALALDRPAVGVTLTEAAACDVPRPCRTLSALRGDEIAWQDFFPDGGASAVRSGRRQDLPPGPDEAISRWSLPVAIARVAAARLAVGGAIPRPAPAYLRPADAAPPRDPAPVILP